MRSVGADDPGSPLYGQPLSHLTVTAMVSHGRSASLFASFCSLFDPRFRLASSRTAGARLRAPLHRGAVKCVRPKALPVDGTRGKRAIYRSNEAQRSVKREGGFCGAKDGWVVNALRFAHEQTKKKLPPWVGKLSRNNGP